MSRPAATRGHHAGPPRRRRPARPVVPRAVAVEAAATPVTAPAGEESPLDVGWTGPVTSTPPRRREPTARRARPPRAPPAASAPTATTSTATATPAARSRPTRATTSSSHRRPGWRGVCDIGRRHRRNEDAMALAAEAPGSRAVLVVCDGVSNAPTRTSRRSPPRGRAGRARPAPFRRGRHPRVVRQPRPSAALADARRRGRPGGREGHPGRRSRRPETRRRAPSSRRWSSRATRGRRQRRRQPRVLAARRRASAGVQLSEDDSFAAAQMSGGMPRKEAETSAGRARDHPLARDRRPRRPHAAHPPVDLPRTAGCSSAATACGTTAPTPPTCSGLLHETAHGSAPPATRRPSRRR